MGEFILLYDVVRQSAVPEDTLMQFLQSTTVPNSTVLSGSTVNYSSNTKPEDLGLILHTTVTIGYDTPWKDMHRALLVAAGRTRWVEKQPESFVLQTGLDDFFVSYQINVYTKEANKQAAIYSELHQHIQDACNEAGIEILSPHYTSVRDGNSTSIPEDYTSRHIRPPENRDLLRKLLQAAEIQSAKRSFLLTRKFSNLAFGN